MPNLPKPRLRRGARARVDSYASAQTPAEPNVEIVEHDGLRWINIERPGALERAWLEEHFEFHALDYEEVVRDISNAKQEIINFRKIIRPQRTVLRDLERTKQRYLAQDLEIYFDDIVDASERIWDMLENYKEVVEALEDTNESVITHRLNNVLRVLTSVSVILLPLTLIASIWGMNVRVPGEQSIVAFWIIIAVMLGVLSGLVAYFRKRGWL